VLFLIKTWHKRYLFVKDELINTYRLLSLDFFTQRGFSIEYSSINQHNFTAKSSGLSTMNATVKESLSILNWINQSKQMFHIDALCYCNGHIRNPVTSVLFLIKAWHKRYLFVKDELIKAYR
jgi:hypothetical protein